MYDLGGKVALITGASSGIGRAIALRLATEGCDVAILDVDEAGAAETVRQVTDLGRRGAVRQCDVADGEQVQRGVRSMLEDFGRVDILVNNAGIARIGTLLEMPESDWRELFRVNVDGVFHCCRAVAPHMVARRQGRIIINASWLGKTGKPYYGGYCATKSALIAITQTLALELAPSGINVNAVCPGVVKDTVMRDYAEEIHERIGLPSAEARISTIPIGRLAVADDVARVTAFLASDEAAYMTGQAINVTGGLWLH
jgi:NAD(P)-dependent dehydrogenase (short-subunit alcohol dehydrogenase family)